MSPTLRHLGPADWQTWRDLRFAALADAPRVFGSSLAAEQGYDEQRWRDWCAPGNGLKVAADGGAGVIGAWLPPDRDGAVELYSMWVHPDWRGRGLADLLVAEVLGWAKQNGHARVELWVTDGNRAAERLYQRHGFRLTGETQPHPVYADVVERVMTRAC